MKGFPVKFTKGEKNTTQVIKRSPFHEKPPCRGPVAGSAAQGLASLSSAARPEVAQKVPRLRPSLAMRALEAARGRGREVEAADFSFFPPKRSQPVAGHGHSGTRNDPAVAPGEKRRGEGQLCRARPPSPPRPSSLRPRPARPGSRFQPRNCSAALRLNKPALCCWLDGKYFPFLKRRRRNCSRLSSSSLCGVIDRL